MDQVCVVVVVINNVSPPPIYCFKLYSWPFMGRCHVYLIHMHWVLETISGIK